MHHIRSSSCSTRYDEFMNLVFLNEAFVLSEAAKSTHIAEEPKPLMLEKLCKLKQ